MPMGIVSEDDFTKELINSGHKSPALNSDNPNPINPNSIKIKIERGRKEGDVNVPDSLRKIIGETSQIEGRQDAIALAKQFGISPSSVSAYANGSKSTDSYDKQPNLDHINGAKDRISKRARKKLMMALSYITPEKLEDAKVRDVAVIARNMAGIIKDMEPDVPTETGNKSPTFVIYNPTVNKETAYDVISVRE